MTDIERLRQAAIDYGDNDLAEAADEIEKLRADLAETVGLNRLVVEQADGWRAALADRDALIAKALARIDVWKLDLQRGVHWRLNILHTILSRAPQGAADPGAHGGPIPRYAMLDVWMAIFGSDRSNEFDAWYDERGYAEAWAELCGLVRRTIPADRHEAAGQ